MDPNNATAHQWLIENIGMTEGRKPNSQSEIDQTICSIERRLSFAA
jgi:hypothetical protein